MAGYPQISVRLNEEFLKRIDEWRRKQDDLPGRPEAIRRLVELGAEGEEIEVLRDAISALVDGSRSRLGGTWIYRFRISPKQER